jgi:hypothetical protein
MVKPLLARAVRNNIRDVRDSYDNSGFEPADQYGVFRLTPGRAYVVYALSMIKNFKVYAVGDDDVEWCGYPGWYDARLFSLSDYVLPADWVSGLDNSLSPPREIMTFPEWAARPDVFYARLVDDLEPEAMIFSRYRKQYEAEADSGGSTGDEPGARHRPSRG